MRERRIAQERLRAREFESFVAGAAGRLLRIAQLLTAELPEEAPAAEKLLSQSLARTYARWDRLRGEDPYEMARQELTSRFAHTAWRYRHPAGGVLGRLSPQERLVVVLRLVDGVAEEQTAAALGLPSERIYGVLQRACGLLLTPPEPEPDAEPGTEPSGPRKEVATS